VCLQVQQQNSYPFSTYWLADALLSSLVMPRGPSSTEHVGSYATSTAW
jgi:hypothetical protein